MIQLRIIFPFIFYVKTILKNNEEFCDGEVQ